MLSLLVPAGMISVQSSIWMDLPSIVMFPLSMALTFPAPFTEPSLCGHDGFVLAAAGLVPDCGLSFKVVTVSFRVGVGSATWAWATCAWANWAGEEAAWQVSREFCWETIRFYTFRIADLSEFDWIRIELISGESTVILGFLLPNAADVLFDFVESFEAPADFLAASSLACALQTNCLRIVS